MVLAAIVLALGAASPAGAGQPAPAERPAVEVSGGGCQPRSLVVFTSRGEPAGSTTSDHLGNFSSEAELPPGANPRRPEITVACGPVAVRMQVEVAAAAERDSTGLALAGAGAGLAVVAAGLVVVVRRRRRDEPEPARAKEAAACAS